MTKRLGFRSRLKMAYNQEVFAEVNLAGTAERKGLKYSIEEMTKIKLLVMNHYLD